MEAIWDIGLKIIHAIQSVECKPLTWLAIFFHYGFNVPIYLLLMTYLLWCKSTKAAIFASCSLIFSNFANDSIKSTLKVARPYVRDPSVFRSMTEPTYSTPSGHSASSASFFPVMAAVYPNWKRVWRILVAILLPVLVALSRCYIGVHYPTDVLGGLMLGYIVSAGVIMFGEKISSIVIKLRPSLLMLICTLICVGFNAISMENVAMSGLFMGICGGQLLLNKAGGFDATAGTKKQKILRYLLGLVIVGIVYLAGKLLSPGEQSAYYNLIRFVRYGACGIGATYVCPMLFIKLKLGEKSPAPAEADGYESAADSEVNDASAKSDEVDDK